MGASPEYDYLFKLLARAWAAARASAAACRRSSPAAAATAAAVRIGRRAEGSAQRCACQLTLAFSSSETAVWASRACCCVLRCAASRSSGRGATQRPRKRALGFLAQVWKRAPLTLWAAQDDTYTESYISTIGVDFVRARGRARSRASGSCLAVVPWRRCRQRSLTVAASPPHAGSAMGRLPAAGVPKLRRPCLALLWRAPSILALPSRALHFFPARRYRSRAHIENPHRGA